MQLPNLQSPASIPCLEEPGVSGKPTDERLERPQADVDSDSPWAPLGVPIFRAFWIASVGSNLGTWVHEVGAGWLMTNLDSSPEMVSAVRIAISAPMMVLAIPAGVIADRIDRRRLLIITQLVLLSTTATLASLTFAEAITSWTLLCSDLRDWARHGAARARLAGNGSRTGAENPTFAGGRPRQHQFQSCSRNRACTRRSADRDGWRLDRVRGECIVVCRSPCRASRLAA